MEIIFLYDCPCEKNEAGFDRYENKTFTVNTNEHNNSNVQATYMMRCAIWQDLYGLKNVKYCTLI